jgi:hypothetical protein
VTTTSPPPLDTATAKARLVEAARAFDPLEVVRKRPFEAAIVAGALGMVCGASGASLRSATSVVTALHGLVKTVAGIAEQLYPGNPADSPPPAPDQETEI